jgi:hypothetical protein
MGSKKHTHNETAPENSASVENNTMKYSGTRHIHIARGATALLSATSCGHTSAESRAQLGPELSIAAGSVARAEEQRPS